MNIGWIAVTLLFLILAIAFWCEQSEQIKKRLFSFFFESTDDTIVTCPSCKTQGVRPLPCTCAETALNDEAATTPLEERLRRKYFG
jgi:hypothetical protein